MPIILIFYSSAACHLTIRVNQGVELVVTIWAVIKGLTANFFVNLLHKNVDIEQCRLGNIFQNVSYF